MRGGRLRKTARGIVTFAPFVLGAIFALPTDTIAAGCAGPTTISNLADATRVCSNVASTSGSDVTQKFHLSPGASARLTDEGNAFGLNVGPKSDSGSDAGDGIHVTTSGSSRNIVLRLTGEGGITADNDAVYVNQIGVGQVDIEITGNLHSTNEEAIEVTGSTSREDAIANAFGRVRLDGNIGSSTAAVGKDGISFTHLRGDHLVIEVEGDIYARGRGIFSHLNSNSGTASTISVTGDIDVDGNGIHVANEGTRATTVGITGSVDSSGGNGILVNTATRAMEGASIAVTGNIRSSKEGIKFNARGTGTAVVNVGGSITSNTEEGVQLHAVGNNGGGATDVRVQVDGAIIGAKYGIHVKHDGTGGLAITTGGDITAAIEDGIYADLASTTSGDVTINAEGDITGGDNGIYIKHGGTGNITLNIHGTVRGSGSLGPIVMRTSAGGSGTIILHDGGGFVGSVFEIVRGGLTLELTGTAADSVLDFSTTSLHDIDAFTKTGAGTWTLTGTHAARARISDTFEISEGKVIWDTTSPFPISGISVAEGASLEIRQTPEGSAPLTLSGVFELTGANSSINVGTLTASNPIVIDIDFTDADDNGMVALTTPRLTVASVASPITININVIGSEPAEAVDITNFATVASGDETSFTLGEITGNLPFEVDLVHTVDAVAGNIWNLMARRENEGNGGDGNGNEGDGSDDGNSGDGGNENEGDGGSDGSNGDGGNENEGEGDGGGDGNSGDGGNENEGDGGGDESNGDGGNENRDDSNDDNDGRIENALFEVFPAALTQLAQISSIQQRMTANGGKVNIWGQAETKHTESKPTNATLNTNFNTRQAHARFGIGLPVTQELLIGANVAIGRAEAEVNIPASTSKGNVQTNAVSTGLSALWRYGNLFSGTQVQYTHFYNKLLVGNETLAHRNKAHAIGTTQEIGYRFDFGSVAFMPQAQVTWSRVDFDNFETSKNQRVSLIDGEILIGRIGIMATGAHFHAKADLRMPIDGETSAKVTDLTLISKSEEIVADIGFGFSYPLKENGVILIGDIETSQGNEIEAYQASLGLRFNF